MTSVKNISLSSLPKKVAEVVEKHPTQFEQIFASMNVTTKNKRIRNKFVKLAVTRLVESMNVVSIPTPTETVVEKMVVSAEAVEKIEKPQSEVLVMEMTETLPFNKLAVGFMLKVGKQFFGSEQVFRSYYNQKHEEYYKNKDLLLSTFQTLVEGADSATYTEIESLIQSQLSK